MTERRLKFTRTQNCVIQVVGEDSIENDIKYVKVRIKNNDGVDWVSGAAEYVSGTSFAPPDWEEVPIEPPPVKIVALYSSNRLTWDVLTDDGSFKNESCVFDSIEEAKSYVQDRGKTFWMFVPQDSVCKVEVKVSRTYSLQSGEGF